MAMESVDCTEEERLKVACETSTQFSRRSGVTVSDGLTRLEDRIERALKSGYVSLTELK